MRVRGSLIAQEKSARFWSASAPAALFADGMAVRGVGLCCNFRPSVPCFRHQEFPIRHLQFAAQRASS
jgi:hypothetical protein